MIETKSSSPLKILVASLNTYKLYPPSEINLSSWLTHSSTTPHLIAIGLQESPLSFLSSQQKSEYRWKQLIERTLANHQLLSSVRLNGMILFIYIRSSHFQRCSAIGTAKVRTGLMNLYGNKGAVGIRLQYDQTSLCFLNCHLAPGETPQALQLRNKQYSYIHQQMSFKSSCQQSRWNISEHNGIFFFGDLNYRRTHTNEDELQTQTDILQTYSEAKIQFPPTYKYKPNSNSYDPSRRSSWTDRILYRNQECCAIRSADYWTTSMIRFSDHRPVASLFYFSRLLR